MWFKKISVTLLFIFTYMCVRHLVSYADWKTNGADWFYINDDGVHIADQIFQDRDSNIYLFDKDGKVCTGYYKNLTNGKIYYFIKSHDGQYGKLVKETGLYDGHIVTVNEQYEVISGLVEPNIGTFYGKIPVHEDKLKIACVGDSITYGLYVENSENTYPSTLQRLLGDKGVVGNFGLSNASVIPGSELCYSDTNVFADSKSYNADIYLLMIGTNDAKEQNWRTVGEFSSAYRMLIKEYQKIGQVVLLLPVTLYNEHVDPGESDPLKLQVIREEIKNIGKELHLKVIDTVEVTDDRSMYLSDGVHLNDNGASHLGSYIYKSLKDMSIGI